jgi:alpha-tubulin suppressor-like RCC1 family protein
MPHPAAGLPLVVTPALLVALLACREDDSRPTEPQPTAADVVAADRPLAFRQVSTGEGRNCGVSNDNVAYCWADDGSSTGTRPMPVPGDHAFRQVSAEGRFHACGVTTENVAYCWGANHFGALGDGSYTDSPQPVRVAGGLSFRQVSTGVLHTCGVTTQNVAYCWGHNQAGPLGDGTTDESNKPVRVARRLAFREVTAGEQFTCGVTTDDRTWCWGVNGSGELGIGDISGPEFCFTGDAEPPCSTRPVRVVRGLAFRTLDAGYGHVCGVTRDDLAYCWGKNGYGELGHGPNAGPDDCGFGAFCSTKPVRVVGGLRFASVTGSVNHTCGVTPASVAYCWGLNEFGQLGIGTRQGPEACHLFFITPEEGAPCSTRPVPVYGEHAFRSVAAGEWFSCGVKISRVAFCWGYNGDGRLGDGTTQSRLRPRRVADPG